MIPSNFNLNSIFACSVSIAMFDWNFIWKAFLFYTIEALSEAFLRKAYAYSNSLKLCLPLPFSSEVHNLISAQFISFC